MNSLFGDTFRKYIDFGHEFKTKRWMETEHDVTFEYYHNLQNRGCIVRKRIGEGGDDDKTSKI